MDEESDADAGAEPEKLCGMRGCNEVVHLLDYCWRHSVIGALDYGGTQPLWETYCYEGMDADAYEYSRLKALTKSYGDFKAANTASMTDLVMLPLLFALLP
jgi:hypothetical protein